MSVEKKTFMQKMLENPYIKSLIDSAVTTASRVLVEAIINALLKTSFGSGDENSE